jgi:hypothetical protein
MKTRTIRIFITAALVVVFTTTFTQASISQDSHYGDLANIPFQQDFPTDGMTQRLTDELLFERGVQSYLWALPAVNMWAMKQGSEARFGQSNRRTDSRCLGGAKLTGQPIKSIERRTSRRILS